MTSEENINDPFLKQSREHKIISDYVQQLSEEEQADVWGETARRFYGLE